MTVGSEANNVDLRASVRANYANAANAARMRQRRVLPQLEPRDNDGGCCAGTAHNAPPRFGAALYGDSIDDEQLVDSWGCGNPTAIAELAPGERVLDLGSGAGLDVLLSARRVGRDGFVYGVDMTDEMLELARENAARDGATNVQFLHGTIEEIPLDDASVDVVISNCVINLSTDKSAVLAEIFRVLTPGGRIGISDVIAEDHLGPHERAQRGSFVGCIAGALSRTEYLEGLVAAGFAQPSVEITHEVAPAMHAAIIRAVKPSGTELRVSQRAPVTGPSH
ncbi:MAG: arsenite methyltransferase [Nitriliruptoraceae bacterium]